MDCVFSELASDFNLESTYESSRVYCIVHGIVILRFGSAKKIRHLRFSFISVVSAVFSLGPETTSFPSFEFCRVEGVVCGLGSCGRTCCRHFDS